MRRTLASDLRGDTETRCIPPDENEERVSRVVDLIGGLGFYDPLLGRRTHGPVPRARGCYRELDPFVPPRPRFCGPPFGAGKR